MITKTLIVFIYNFNSLKKAHDSESSTLPIPRRAFVTTLLLLCPRLASTNVFKRSLTTWHTAAMDTDNFWTNQKFSGLWNRLLCSWILQGSSSHEVTGGKSLRSGEKPQSWLYEQYDWPSARHRSCECGVSVFEWTIWDMQNFLMRRP